MCTSLTYTDTRGGHYFARTMDFPTTTPWRPIFLPRGYQWPTGLQTNRTTHYAILGGGRLPIHFASCLMADGLNEAGLTCAELYLPHAAHYQSAAQTDQINLTPQGFINWVLGEHATVAEVQADLPRVNLVAGLWGGADQVYPFHWFISDQTGAQIVIEPTTPTLHAQANPAGVLTNTPTLPVHLTNLQRLLDVADQPFEAVRTAAQNWVASQRPLPSGVVPTRRFNHMAIRRLGSPQLTPAQAPTTLLDWLAAVSIPFDPAKRNQVSHNYTHYRSVIDLTHATYHFVARTTLRHQQIQLTPTMAATWHAPFIFRAD